ncbi:3-isopropylmalate dehydratase [Petroclostridium sp. X23]|uniref:LeuD/DmdB family oxidoreductase small subunit n=1 Tax=Petroclostridium sp. X23 TaxID=3045146 RepID=UPI0024AE6851|nr:3-isopropylmalate dehydratase [Petroclostridium sp. X23]WHH60632.1 3-isopropylmalate dehydratase [Petroclostridium sp. X23]
MTKTLKGRVMVFGDNIDTDMITPGRYLELSKPEEIAAVAMAGLDPDFPKKVKKGDIIIGGKNFGCGSSREHGVIAFKANGVQAIVAKSIAKIYYRNAIVSGLMVLISEEAHTIFENYQHCEIDLENGNIINTDTGKSVKCEKLSTEDIAIWEAGGMVTEYKRKAQEINRNSK